MTRASVMLFRARLALARAGALRLGAAALWLAACGALAWGVPQLRAQQRAHAAELARLRATLASPPPVFAAPPAPSAERLARFQAVLGDARHAEQELRTLFALAEKSGLDLARADYKLGADRDGGFQRYQIVLPVTGRYPAILDFCRRSLLAMPHAALTDIGFKRANIASATVEARLNFTLYLADTPAAPRRFE